MKKKYNISLLCSLNGNIKKSDSGEITAIGFFDKKTVNVLLSIDASLFIYIVCKMVKIEISSDEVRSIKTYHDIFIEVDEKYEREIAKLKLLN